MSSDSNGVKIKAHFKLEKFDGDKVEGQKPVEIIEGEFDLDDPIERANVLKLVKGNGHGTD